MKTKRISINPKMPRRGKQKMYSFFTLHPTEKCPSFVAPKWKSIGGECQPNNFEEICRIFSDVICEFKWWGKRKSPGFSRVEQQLVFTRWGGRLILRFECFIKYLKGRRGSVSRYPLKISCWSPTNSKNRRLKSFLKLNHNFMASISDKVIYVGILGGLSLLTT